MSSPLPEHLDQGRATGVAPGQPIAQFEIGPLRNLVYLVIDWESRKCAWVDPQKDLSAPIEAMRAHGLQLDRIFLTHTHHDHVAGLAELAALHPAIPIHLGQADLHRLGDDLKASPRLQLAREGDSIRLGRTSVTALETPGHSAGAISFLVEGAPPALLSGDTVFVRDCGRTDLPTGSNDQMFATLQRLRSLPPETLLLPGHHYAAPTASTLGQEFQTSPAFLCRTVQELEALV